MAVIGLLALIPRGVGEHFIFPTEAFRWLVRGQDPYGVILPRCTGPFLYSPASAYLLFSFFSLFPEKLGEVLYTASGAALFLFSLVIFLRMLKDEFQFDLNAHPLRHLAWLMVSSELMGAILATKLELFLVAGGLFGFSWALRGRWALAGICFAAICNFKLQALPAVLLFTIPSLRNRRGLSFFLSFSLASLFFFFIPWPLLGSWRQFIVINTAWFAALDSQVSTEWMFPVYQHFFGFLAGQSVPMNLLLAKRLMAGFGGTLALVLAAFSWGHSRGEKNLQESLLLAFGLGCLYTVAFSPLSQSNAYICYLPSVFCFLYFSSKARLPIPVQAMVMGVVYAFVSITYSDLVPRSIYHIIYGFKIKPLAAVVFMLFLVMAGLLTTKQNRIADVANETPA